MQKITFCFLFFLNIAHSQAPNISYPPTDHFAVNQPISNLTPTNSGGNVVAQTLVSTFAGSGNPGSLNANGTAATFNLPTTVAVDSFGNVYVVDRSNHKIRKITTGGTVSTFAGSGVSGSADGTGEAASFRFPDGAAFDSHDNLFISDQSNHKIRKITPDGTVTTVAGTGSIGSADGIGTAASFYYPAGMAVDANDNLLIADYGNNKIRKITPDGTVSTFAGTGVAGAGEGSSATAQFNGATGVCVDSFGNVFVADYYNNKIRKIDTLGNVSTFAGTGTAGTNDGDAATASFHSPAIVAVDAGNNLFVTDEENNKIRKITPDGMVATYAGTGAVGSADGISTAAQFNACTGIAVDAMHNIFVADYANNKIRKINTYGYSVSPGLPAGLSLNENTGTISGTPTVISPATDYTITASNTEGTGSFVINIAVEAALGLPTAAASSIKIYPNPVKDILIIRAPIASAKIEISNLLGQKILMLSNLTSEASINVSFLEKGSYIVNIITGNSTKEFKLIKQ
ncbi:MAG: T9SS type A sorting domain-containing protein [Flavobacterium sp.]